MMSGYTGGWMLTGWGLAQLQVQKFSLRQYKSHRRIPDAMAQAFDSSSIHTIYQCANLGCAKIKIFLPKFDPIKNCSWGFIRCIKRNIFLRGIKKQMKLEGGKKFGQK
jgi:hypothetical protein